MKHLPTRSEFAMAMMLVQTVSLPQVPTTEEELFRRYNNLREDAGIRGTVPTTIKELGRAVWLFSRDSFVWRMTLRGYRRPYGTNQYFSVMSQFAEAINLGVATALLNPDNEGIAAAQILKDQVGLYEARTIVLIDPVSNVYAVVA